MKDNLKTFFSTGILFGIIMGVFLGIFNGVYGGIVGGVITGSIFGLIITLFIQIQKKKFKRIGSEITNGKNIIMDGGANHFKGAEGVGGWLYLTPDEIIFKSHAFNVQAHQTIIPLDKIAEAKAVLTAGFIPNGLLIKTKDGNMERFVVNNRKTWVQKINNAVHSMNS